MATKIEKIEKTVGETWTQSRLNTFLTCERKEWFQYQVDGTGVKRKMTEDYFLEGEFLHYALSMWYSHPPNGLMLKENMVKKIKEQIDAIGEMDPEDYQRKQQKLAAMTGAALAYKMRYKDDFKKWDILAVEQAGTVEIAGINFEFRLDLVVRDRSDGSIGFIEHKGLSQFGGSNYANLPLNLQQLVYTLAVPTVLSTKELPKWYVWNVVRKSSLRLKTKPQESLIEFEVRVQQQYMEKPDEMFMRTPPRRIQASSINELKDAVDFHVGNWKKIHDQYKTEPPPMRFSSCEGKYNSQCPFAEACTARMDGHAQGWNAPECKGLYVKKTSQHEELE